MGRETYHDGREVDRHLARTHGHDGGFEVSVFEKTFDGEQLERKEFGGRSTSLFRQESMASCAASSLMSGT